jgi:hypothetical protein
MNDELLEIELLVDKKIIIETLSRIGIVIDNKRTLYPSCYLWQMDNKYYLAHFKQLFKFLNEKSYDNLIDDDLIRRNSIAFCLEKWGLIKVINNEMIKEHNKFVFILPYNEKQEWTIKHKIRYTYR